MNKNIEIIGNEEIVNKITDLLIKHPDNKLNIHRFIAGDFFSKTMDYLDSVKTDPLTKIIFNMDFESVCSIRKERKDLFSVAVNETYLASPEKQYNESLRMLKGQSHNLLLSYDHYTQLYMIIAPEEAAYHQTKFIDEVLENLVDMALKRSHLTFTRSTVIAGESVPWNSELVPSALRTVVNYCINKNAYKALNNATVGHFAAKINDTTFLTSKRKSNFNDLDKIGLVKVETDGPDSVLAYGSKPSVGGQSQRIVFNDHQEYDLIVHFHSMLRDNHPDDIPIVSQRDVECGSKKCGENTSNGLRKFGNLSAVMLDNHGPNIVFNRSIDPQEVINFIERNFDLSSKTGGYNLI